MYRFHTKENIYVTEIALKVQDITRAIGFYTNILGFKILEEKEEEVILTVDGSTPIIRLISSKDIIPKIPRRTGLYHFAILLPDNIQLGLFLKHIRDKAYPIIGGSNHGVSEAIYLEDPDDNGIEIYADLPSDLWRRNNDKIEMVTLPLDYNTLIEKTGDAQWKGMPSNAIIGHIHLHVADLEESKKFYIDGMGLDLVMEMPNSAVFLSSAGYHHHIAFNIWNGKGAEALPDNSVGMKYYTVKLPNEETRHDIVNNLENLGYNVFMESDNIFVKDPSNNLIKLLV